MKQQVIFSGGGSGGHVMPAVTLIKELKKRNPAIEIYYIGGLQGIEREIIEKMGLPYYGISTGKLRRYLTWENVKDIFRVFKGFIQSLSLLGKFPRGSVVFCTGGFVTVPVAFAAFFRGMKLYVHEQTTRVGLANRLCAVVANKIFVSFKESIPFFPPKKTYLSGYPLRAEMLAPIPSPFNYVGKDLCTINRPLLFITGGGNGSLPINQFIKKWLPELQKRYFIVHQVGSQFLNEFTPLKNDNYHPVAFIQQEMIPLMKLAKVVISRSGAGTVSELMALGRPSLLIPLKIAQKNEQYHNAMAAAKKVGSLVVQEDDLGKIKLPEVCLKLESMNSIQVRDDDLASARELLALEILEA